MCSDALTGPPRSSIRCCIRNSLVLVLNSLLLCCILARFVLLKTNSIWQSLLNHFSSRDCGTRRAFRCIVDLGAHLSLVYIGVSFVYFTCWLFSNLGFHAQLEWFFRVGCPDLLTSFATETLISFPCMILKTCCRSISLGGFLLIFAKGFACPVNHRIHPRGKGLCFRSRCRAHPCTGRCFPLVRSNRSKPLRRLGNNQVYFQKSQRFLRMIASSSMNSFPFLTKVTREMCLIQLVPF